MTSPPPFGLLLSSDSTMEKMITVGGNYVVWMFIKHGIQFWSVEYKRTHGF